MSFRWHTKLLVSRVVSLFILLFFLCWCHIVVCCLVIYTPTMMDMMMMMICIACLCVPHWFDVTQSVLEISNSYGMHIYCSTFQIRGPATVLIIILSELHLVRSSHEIYTISPTSESEGLASKMCRVSIWFKHRHIALSSLRGGRGIKKTIDILHLNIRSQSKYL